MHEGNSGHARGRPAATTIVVLEEGGGGVVDPSPEARGVARDILAKTME